MAMDYGNLFRDAYTLLHGGGTDDYADAPPRKAGEPLEDYLTRTRVGALGATRKRILDATVPVGLEEVHRLLVDLLANAAQADEALAEQVKAYQCGQFHESVAHSERLQELVVESQRMDRELIRVLKGMAPELRGVVGIELPGEEEQV
jgi:hypothetical protein